MRVELLEPSGDLTPEITSDALLLLEASDHRTADQLRALTPLELHLVYDWAMREHLTAGDNKIRRRQRPRLLELVHPEGMETTIIGEQAKTIAEQALEIEQLRTQLIQVSGDLEETQARVVDLEGERVH